MIRRYDQALLNFLKLDINGEKIPISFMVQRREYGKRSEMLNPEDQNLGHPIGRRDDQILAEPYMVITPMGWVRAPGRDTVARDRHIRYSQDLNLITSAQMPMAYDFAYQLDIISKFADDANYLTAQILIKFPRNGIYLDIDLGDPWGVRPVYLICGNVQDLTNLEEDDHADRESRKVIDFTLEGYLPLPATEVRTVRKVEIETDFNWVEDARGLDAIVSKQTVEEG